ncbi:hypothetical protein GCM10010326_03650 [Streptomyces xanthochromogenes]|uniref:Uncharacterized protein n=1 Tax=Streptomyces xanthochromogenes TaxID=67384 RepID=A0ABQ2ZJY2_9ACTN|nr:hypothetical protein GCM10010326_03650 [Streptomyces xanthochromogenes]
MLFHAPGPSFIPCTSTMSRGPWEAAEAVAAGRKDAATAVTATNVEYRRAALEMESQRGIEFSLSDDGS